MFRALAVLVLALAVALTLVAPAAAQSQAVNGSIEGTVVDTSGAVLPGVTVTVTNIDTGASRTVVTNERGLFRAPLLPLGTYRVLAEIQGFKKFEQAGVTLAAGQTAVVDITMGVGNVTEVVSVTADAPIVDPGKIDLGRNLNEREVKMLPLVSRNPYNFALLQPGVSGFENSEFGVPRFSANGSLLRINYQIDGNTNTQKDRAGLRLLPMSEVMVREVKVVTSGYAPEFGQTTGLVYNAVTPSGTNTVRGEASYRFRRRNMSARPFYFASTPLIPDRPDTHVDTITADVGGPFIRDRLHYYFGFENTKRGLSADRVITIDQTAAARIGLTPDQSSGVMPAGQTVRFFIGKADYQVNPAHRVTARYILFRNSSPNNVGGGANSTEWATDFTDAMDSLAGQVVSTLGSNKLNELRVQYARRHQSRVENGLSGTGPAIVVSGVANFGGPIDSDQTAGFDFNQGIFQIVENFSWIRGNHSLKLGGDFQLVRDTRTTTSYQKYTFPSVDAYLAAKAGLTPRSYTSFAQLLGPADFKMSTQLYSLFVQDDWRVTPDLKVLYGIRYDLYNVPEGDPAATVSDSRSYSVDRNNIGPRVGVAWTLGRSKRTVLRASTGIMYDQPLLAAYENAIQQNGLRALPVSLSPTSAGAPDFPGVLSGSSGVALPVRSPSTVDPAFRTGRTFQNNVQIDHALGSDYSVRVGFVYVRGSNLPVITDINIINPTGALGDGRPVYSTAVSSATRVDPQFNHIYAVQSVGDSTYRAMTLQLTKRFTHGVQFDLTYALGKGSDNAPLTSALSVQGDDGRSDPTNLERDRGPNILDTRHTFAGSIVATPTYASDNALLHGLLNNNQFGIMLQLNSGLPFTIRSNRDLNQDGTTGNDRPLAVGRNSMYLPARYNADFRYSRFIPVRGAMKGEVVVEFKNLFNNRQTAGVNRTVATDAAGNPVSPIPSSADAFPMAGRSGYEARQFQLGFKFNF
ncbi:MAG: TonB-dependent receptor [Acidobacteria bacterium]|nr:TonB-dependent receptor [Acidobacteriota bacterium]